MKNFVCLQLYRWNCHD